MVSRSRQLTLLLATAAPLVAGLTVIEATRRNARGVTVSAAAPGALATAAVDTRLSARGTYQNDWRVSLWEVVFDIEDVAEIRTPKGPVRRVTRFDDMRYFVGPLPDMMVTGPPHIWGSFTQTILVGGQVEMDSKSASRPHLPVSSENPARGELLVGREVKLCDDAISMQSEGARRYSWPQPNMFVISNNLIWPRTATTYYSPPGKRVATVDVDSAQPLLTLTEQEVPYDYRELINRGRATLPPFRAAGGFRQISRTIDYTIVRQQTMKLEFLPQCRPDGARPRQNPPECVPNLVGDRALECITCTVVTDNYAFYGTDFFFIHPNVEVRLKIGNEDVTTVTRRRPNGQLRYFDVLRLRRAWQSGLRRNNEGDGNYRLETEGPNGWIDDETGKPETGAFAEPNWRDMPAPGETRQPSGWEPKRVLQEFLLGVKDFPEFGFLYYATIVDMGPGWYRVRKSDGERITAEEWCRIKRSPRPRWTGLNPLDDISWSMR